MKTFRFVFLLLSIATTTVQAETLWVHLPASTFANDQIFLTGSNGCNWNPTCLQAQIVQPGLARFDIPSSWRWSAEAGAPFKVTRGSWEQEAADRSGRNLSNLQWPGRELSHEIRLESWVDRGGLGVYERIEISEVNCERLGRNLRLRVWHPTFPSAPSNGIRELDVIYALDGQNAFDPNGNPTNFDWGYDDLLRFEGARAPVVIGLDAGAARRQEYDMTTSTGQAHFACLRDQVLARFEPNLALEKSFRVRHRYIVGSSMGALAALATAWNMPDQFTGAAGLSLPAFLGGGRYFDLFRSANRSQKALRLYFDHGDRGQDATYASSNETFLQRLRTLDVQNVSYRTFEKADHSEVDWAARLRATLEWLRIGQP